MTHTPSALTCRGVVKHFRDLTALDGLDLTVAPGEVLALVGFNGAGKTTLMRVALGMCRADAGKVTVLGADLTCGESDWSRVGHLIGPRFGYPELTVSEDLLMPPRGCTGWPTAPHTSH